MVLWCVVSWCKNVEIGILQYLKKYVSRSIAVFTVFLSDALIKSRLPSRGFLKTYCTIFQISLVNEESNVVFFDIVKGVKDDLVMGLKVDPNMELKVSVNQ